MSVSLAPLVGLRTQADWAASNPDLKPSERVALLHALRDEVNGVIGEIDGYIEDVRLEESAQDVGIQEALVYARENADLREALLERGLATAEELDEQGLASHQALDRMAAEGALEEGVLGAVKKWTEGLHPRGQPKNKGEFAKKAGGSVHYGGEKRVGNYTTGAPEVPGAERTLTRKRRFRRDEKVDVGKVPTPPKGERTAKPAGISPKDREALIDRERGKQKQGKSYEERSKELDKRAYKEIEKGTQGSIKAQKRGEMELRLNQAGGLNQHELIEYARLAATQPTTAERYRNEHGDWDPGRKALHDWIIQTLLDHHQSQENPTAVFSGGGYAAGKGGMLDILKAQGQLPKDHMKLDPDEIKALLPEFEILAYTDPEANLLVTDEAWEIAQELQRRAQALKINVVVDGIGNTSADEMAKRIKSFKKAGYGNLQAAYIEIPTLEAADRAAERAKAAKEPKDRRHVPAPILRAVYRDVSATVPALLEHAQELGVHIAVYNNNQGEDENGNFKGPKEILHMNPGDTVPKVTDTKAWAEFRARADERIPGVQDPKLTEGEVGKALDAAMEDAPAEKPKQPVNDLPALFALGHKTLPEFQKMLDLGQGLSEDIGAKAFVDDYEGAKSHIPAHADEPAVVIAPLKGEKRAKAKVKDKYKGDASQLLDVVRGTVVVPNPMDIPKVMDKVRESGWKVTYAENRMVQNTEDFERQPGPTYNYRDVQLILQAPSGMQVELQINTDRVWEEKEAGAGHKHFEILRGSVKAGDDQTAKLAAKAEAGYKQAWRDSLEAPRINLG